ncbi:hypothetical protein, partial [Moorena sp. SIO3H5]|uniref:hypothetical protein n=1 Tax=Moorena sp. SIO3H5 TaxID=2607834 RepID=UPI0025D1582F
KQRSKPYPFGLIYDIVGCALDRVTPQAKKSKKFQLLTKPASLAPVGCLKAGIDDRDLSAIMEVTPIWLGGKPRW